MSRRASLLVEMAAALAGAAMIAGMVALAAREHRDVLALERAMAELETAQNLLDSLRHGDEPGIPAGWSIERAAAGDGIELVTVHGPARAHQRIQLATLRRIAADERNHAEDRHGAPGQAPP